MVFQSRLVEIPICGVTWELGRERIGPRAPFNSIVHPAEDEPSHWSHHGKKGKTWFSIRIQLANPVEFSRQSVPNRMIWGETLNQFSFFVDQESATVNQAQ